MIADVFNKYDWDIGLRCDICLCSICGLADIDGESKVISSAQTSRWVSPKLMVGSGIIPGSSEKIRLRRCGLSPVTHSQIGA